MKIPRIADRIVVLLFLSLFFISGCVSQNKEPQDDKKPIVVSYENKDSLAQDEDVASEEKKEAAVEPISASNDISKEKNDAEISQTPKSELPKYSEEVIVANFDSGEKPSSLGGNFGAWNKDPSDPTQWCRESFDNTSRHGDIGFAMRLDYSVDSPNSAYNGFWMTLPDFDATKYDAINFWVKGDPKEGYTTVFKVELKNSIKQIGRYYVSNVSDRWQEISIPLSEFKGLIDKNSLTEFVIVFEDRMVSNKKGTLYIDDIRFVKK